MQAPTKLAGLLKWETGAGDVRLCDGGTLVFNSETYLSKHPIFGSLAGFDSISEGVNDEAPAGVLMFSPAPDADIDVINSPDLQGTPLKMWIAEVDRETGAIIGTPEQVLNSMVDAPRIRAARGKLMLEVDIISRAERLFLLNEGNYLSGEYHRRLYPGERGLDNATGVPRSVPWGVAGAPRGTSSGGLFGRIAETIEARQ